MFRIATLILSITLLLAGSGQSLHAENIFQKIARIGASPAKLKADSISAANESSKKAKKQKKIKLTSPPIRLNCRSTRILSSPRSTINSSR